MAAWNGPRCPSRPRRRRPRSAGGRPGRRDARLSPVGTAESPFSLADLPPGEDVELRLFVDKYVVEIFVNDRQAMIAAHLDYAGKPAVTAFTVGSPTTLKTVEIWRLEPANQGLLEARQNRVWEPDKAGN